MARDALIYGSPNQSCQWRPQAVGIASENAETEDGDIADTPATKGSTPTAGRDNNYIFFCELQLSKSGVARMSMIFHLYFRTQSGGLEIRYNSACMLLLIDLPLLGCLLRADNELLLSIAMILSSLRYPGSSFKANRGLCRYLVLGFQR